MADTIRTRADLVALMADNITGDASPQDFRDWLISTEAADGCLAVTATAGTVVTAGTPILLAGTTTLGLATNVSMPSNMRLRNDAPTTMRFHVTADISMTTAANNVVASFWIYKNGVQEAGSLQKRKIGTGTDVGSLGLNWVVDLAPTDYVEIYVDLDTSTTLTADAANMLITSRLI